MPATFTRLTLPNHAYPCL